MIKILKRFNLKEMILIFIIFLLILIQVFVDLEIPDYMAEITRLVQMDGNKLTDIIINGIYMILFSFVSLILAIIVGYLSAVLVSNLSLNLRRDLFEKTENLSVGQLKKISVDSLITRCTNDIVQVEYLVIVGLNLLIKAPITAVWAISKILNKNLEWSIIVLASVLILLFSAGIIMFFVVPRFEIIQKLIDKVNLSIREHLSGIRVIRAFNAEKYQENRFNKINLELMKNQLFNQRLLSFLSPIMFFVMNAVFLAIYFVGAYIINNSVLSLRVSLFGDMIVFASYAMQVIMAFLMLAMVFMILPRSRVSAKRINEVLNEDILIKYGDFVEGRKIDKHIVQFKNVSFKYPNAEEYVIKDVNFNVSSGEAIAFIGSTGSGKSTLVNLLARFYDVTDGDIFIDEVNIKDYSEESLNKKIGYVSQKAVIFSESVKDNILFGSDFNINRLKDALKISQSEEFVMKMENGYNTKLAQGGSNISGGQKQRISIARVIAKKPDIYIFDDSFSALDYKTDYNLRKELKKYTKDSIVFVVSQRVGTIMNADKIIVLSNGKVVGDGTHKELLDKCNVYKEIALSQLSEEELKNE